MKTKYTSILTLLAFLLCAVAFASTGKDSLVVGKHTRTFATPPVAATNVVSVTKAVHPPVSSTVNVSTRSFESLDKQIEKNYKALHRTQVSEFTPAYFEELLAAPQDSTEVVEVLKAQAISVFEELANNGNIVDALDFQQILDELNPLEPITFPIGLQSTCLLYTSPSPRD